MKKRAGARDENNKDVRRRAHRVKWGSVARWENKRGGMCEKGKDKQRGRDRQAERFKKKKKKVLRWIELHTCFQVACERRRDGWETRRCGFADLNISLWSDPLTAVRLYPVCFFLQLRCNVDSQTTKKSNGTAFHTQCPLLNLGLGLTQMYFVFETLCSSSPASKRSLVFKEQRIKYNPATH